MSCADRLAGSSGPLGAPWVLGASLPPTTVARVRGERWIMKAVVDESRLGNTAKVASAIAEGIGPGAEAMSGRRPRRWSPGST